MDKCFEFLLALRHEYSRFYQIVLYNVLDGTITFSCGKVEKVKHQEVNEELISGKYLFYIGEL